MPGIPKIPAITAVKGLITMLIPKNPPMKLAIKSSIPPKIPFIMSFIMSLIGITRSIPTRYNKKSPAKKAKTTPISIQYSPLYCSYYIIWTWRINITYFPSPLPFLKNRNILFWKPLFHIWHSQSNLDPLPT